MRAFVAVNAHDKHVAEGFGLTQGVGVAKVHEVKAAICISGIHQPASRRRWRWRWRSNGRMQAGCQTCIDPHRALGLLLRRQLARTCHSARRLPLLSLSLALSRSLSLSLALALALSRSNLGNHARTRDGHVQSAGSGVAQCQLLGMQMLSLLGTFSILAGQEVGVDSCRSLLLASGCSMGCFPLGSLLHAGLGLESLFALRPVTAAA